MGRSSRSEDYVFEAVEPERTDCVAVPGGMADHGAAARAAGLRAGMSCLDVGCGGGDVTLKMAALVGAEGRVVGVDRDQTILHLARREAENRACR